MSLPRMILSVRWINKNLEDLDYSIRCKSCNGEANININYMSYTEWTREYIDQGGRIKNDVEENEKIFFSRLGAI